MEKVPKQPSCSEISELLTMLLDKEVSLKESSPLSMQDESVWVAVFCGDENELLALWISTLESVAQLGAALSMLPTGVVNDAIRAKNLEGTLRDNAQEVMNILSSLMNETRFPHVILKEFSSLKELDSQYKDFLNQTPAARSDFICKVDSYGEGLFSILLFEQPEEIFQARVAAG